MRYLKEYNNWLDITGNTRNYISREIGNAEKSYIINNINQDILSFIRFKGNGFFLEREGYYVVFNGLNYINIINYFDRGDDWIVSMFFKPVGLVGKVFRFGSVEDFCDFINNKIQFIKK